MANLRPGQHAGSQWKGKVDLPSYISGYVDGEGCFTVSISPRPTLRVGWEVRPSRSDQTLKWEVRSLPLLVERIVPHFRDYPLQSGKRRDFELFAEICELMVRGEHRVPSGLSEIVRMAHAMNPSGKRGYSQNQIIQSLDIEMKA